MYLVEFFLYWSVTNVFQERVIHFVIGVFDGLFDSSKTFYSFLFQVFMFDRRKRIFEIKYQIVFDVQENWFESELFLGLFTGTL